MKKFKFSEIKEGETYLLYDGRYDTGKRVVCVYDHTKRLMSPMKKHRPLKYFMEASNAEILSAEQVEQYMNSDEKVQKAIGNIIGVWEDSLGASAGYSLFATE